MKKILQLLSIIGFISILTGCLPFDSDLVSEPCFPYKIDLNVINESATSKEISTQAYSLFDYHGDHDAQWLSRLTHMEDPWKLARKGIPEGAGCNRIITKESMAEYYGSL